MSLSTTSITTAHTTHATSTSRPCRTENSVCATWVRVQPSYNGMHRGDHSISACAGYSIVVDEDVLHSPAPVTRYVYLEPLS